MASNSSCRDAQLMFLLPGLQQFAIDSMMIPSGVRGGMRYRADVNPVTHHVLGIYDEFLNDQNARELFLLAGNQVGKTLSLITLACYVLLEMREDIIIFAPTLQIAQAVGGEILRVMDSLGVKYERGVYNTRFENGVVMTWRGQSDAQRSQVTARIVLVTEAEKIRQRKTEEAHPIDQIRARVMSYTNGKIFFESTLTSESGLMWSGVSNADVQFRFHHRCPSCDVLFVPCVDHVLSDCYACSECGTAISSADRAVAVTSGEFIRVGSSGRVYGIRYSALDGLLIDPLPEIYRLKCSKDLNDIRRLYLQYVAEPPKVVFTPPPDPPAFAHRRGQVDAGDYWSIGVDVGGSVAHWVLTTYTPGSRQIKISDFGKVRGAFKNQVDILHSIISGLNEQRGCLLFDYGFNGAHLVRLWNNQSPRQRVLPIRGINERSFVIDPAVDISYGDFWRYRRMKGSGIYNVQVYTVSAKDAVFGLLYTSRLVMFTNDGQDISVKQFLDSICRSERPIEKNGQRLYELVGQSNHYFDALVYSVTGLLFSGAPIDLSALPPVEPAGVVYEGQVEMDEYADANIADVERKPRMLRKKVSTDQEGYI